MSKWLKYETNELRQSTV